MGFMETLRIPQAERSEKSKPHGYNVTPAHRRLIAGLARMESRYHQHGRTYGAGRIVEEAVDYWVAHSQHGRSLYALLRDEEGE